MASRSRSRTTSAPERMSWSYGGSESSEFYSQLGAYSVGYDSALVTASYKETSSIIDNGISVSMPGLKAWKTCDHLRRQPSWPYSDTKVCFTFSPPTPSLYIRPIVYLSPKMFSTPSTVWSPIIEDLATQLQKGSESDFQLLVSLGEMRQTLQMIKNPLSVLKTGFRDNPIGKAGAKLKMLSSIWLSGRYGWKPFLSDIENFSKCLAKNMYSTIPKTVERFSSRNVSETHSDRLAGNITLSGWDSYAGRGPNWSNTLGGFYILENYNERVTATVTCYALSPLVGLTNLLQKMVISTGATASWRNIRDVIWELLPFSFVIDWFIDFSDVWRPLNDATILRRASNRIGFSEKLHVTANPKWVFGIPVPCQGSSTVWNGKAPTNTTAVIAQFPQFSGTRYIRSVGLPTGASEILKSKGLSLIHGIDGISLFLQKAILH